MHGNLKDFLVEYRENLDQLNCFPSLLQEKPQGSSSSTSSSAAFSLAYAALQDKVPLSQQNSVFSTSSEGPRSDLSSQVLSADGTDTYCRCLTQDSGYYRGDSVRTAASSSSQECSCSGSSCYLQVETIQNFALQIAQGLQHLESLSVSFCFLFCF